MGSLSNGQKALIGIGILAGAAALYKGVSRAVNDFSQNFKFFFTNFRIHGFARDQNGKAQYGQLRTVTTIGLYNQSMVSLVVRNIWLSIEYYDPGSKSWYPFAASNKVLDRIDIPAKQQGTKQITLDVNFLELFYSKFWKLITAPVDFRLVAVFEVYGIQQRSVQSYRVSFPTEILSWARPIVELFKKKNSTGTNGIGAINGSRQVPAWVKEIWYGDKPCFSPEGIGYTASRRRILKPGYEYNSFIQNWTTPNRRTVIHNNASVEQTVAYINQIANETAIQTKRLAEYLYSPSLKQFGKNIWQFLYDHVQYKLDKDGEEELREPARAWKDRNTGVDCDCYALFISTILRNKKIPHFFRVVKMYGKSHYQHIYVVVPYNMDSFKWNDSTTYVTIDPVMDYFGSDPNKVTGVLDVKAKF